ncbi:sugar phosphate isomerase/epimerase family protein [Gracilinema caldarium]|uniref:Xylose isomerase domain-containing protein TIM barrel n=1 Tax=Gracilinema caldarium (strain ATCC 51460 / DSM 7334 / H1) TaxID=744872 RepID=F8EX52_GRAC1|nr:sugar phosphate isomerase/epimerase family protein [Gracilinema caldarium]AEJ18795.1 Xylose isomerase domain-containing protein TIM barrel [Gracilinema caldarium DSM 7334]
MIRFGCRAHDFGKKAPEELAQDIAKTGVECVQLALSKALPESPASPGITDVPAIVSAFNSQNLQIAVLGCYINPVHPDLNERTKALARFEDHLAWAPNMGCAIVGTETGSVQPDCSYHPETLSDATFKQLVISITRLVRYAENIGPVIVGIEPVAEKHTIQSPALVKRLLDEIDSPALGVIFDPVNLVPETGIRLQDAFLDECFESFGSKIIAIHAKDYILCEGSCGPVKSKSLPAGTGELDWAGVFRRMKRFKLEGLPVLIEDIDPRFIAKTRAYLQKLWDDTC